MDALARIANVIDNVAPSSISLDISVLPKTYLFGICRLLLSSGVATQVRYYKPSIYGRSLSRGIGSVNAISGFDGDISSTGEIFLAIVLGFEGYKALHVWESIGPTKCAALLGTPPYRDEFLEYSKKSNEDLLGVVDGMEFGEVHTFDVQLAIEQLTDVFRQAKTYGPNMSFVLCPLGTKLQSLACFGLAYNNPEITIANVSSLIYYSEDYSSGVDRCYTELSLQNVRNWGAIHPR